MSFVPAHSVVSASETGASAWMMVLHGIYGRGNNWRTFARRLTEARPEWGTVLVDLRMHGRSSDAPLPHTVARAAEDLLTLADQLRGEGRFVRAVCGHSFGGKVALSLRGLGPDWLQQTWMLDASPTARPQAIDDGDNSVVRVLQMLEGLPPRFADRDAFVAHVTGLGFEAMLGRWLAMNLEPDGDGAHRFGLDPAAMRSLLADYYALDLWDAVEDPNQPGDLHVLAAGRSDVVSERDRDRLAKLEPEMSGAVRYHFIEDSGHWVHIDALDPLVELVAAELPKT